MRRWFLKSDIDNDPNWIVDHDMGIARRKDGPPNEFFFLCDRSEDVGKPQTETHKELMQEQMVEIDINGAKKMITMSQFRKQFSDWSCTIDDDEKIDTAEVEA